jgi:ubiquinone/menaquinone biosynthesis C-methylase UbiE
MRSNLALQCSEHPLVAPDRFESLVDFGIFLMHKRDYQEAARLLQGRTVLDLGCNNGYGASILASTCREVHAVDVSAAAIEDAVRRFGDLGIAFSRVDGRRLPFADAAFDAIVSFQVIEHVDDVDTYLSEIVRVLKGGGRALFTTPNKKLRLKPGMKPWNRFHVQEFAHDELRCLLSSYFTRVRLRGQFASERMYRLERRRCEAARAQADGRLRAHLRSTVQSFVRPAWWPHLRAMRARLLYRQPVHGSFSEAEAKGYSSAEYFYLDTDLDDALTLFADCRNAR